MKRVFFLFVLLVAGYGICSAQCDKKYKMKTERVVEIREDSTEGDEQPVTAEITLSKDSIFIIVTTPDGSIIEIYGKLIDKVCKMNADFTDGSYDFTVDAERSRNGETRKNKLFFNLKSKEGKIKIYAVPEENQQEKICLVIKEKEEVK
jgi:hypothetical protein